MHHPNLLLAQLNPIVGDITGNAQKIMDAYKQADANRASMVICPELCLLGYPAEDLVLMPAFRAEAMKKAREIAAATGEAGLVFGTLWEEADTVYNAAIFAAYGRIQHIHHKIMLPNDGIFDEKRVFTAGNAVTFFIWQGRKIALLVCEDVWHLQYMQEAKREGAEMIIVINGSPFDTHKMALRKKTLALASKAAHAPIVYVNMTGGQDDIVFDGGSFIIDAQGHISAQALRFAEGNFKVRSPLAARQPLPEDEAQPLPEPLPDEASIWSAMKMGLADYLHKNGFSDVVLGLSGGIDSAVSAALAVDALGAEHVRGVLLPSPYTSAESNEDALELARLLGIRTDTIPISDAMQTMEQSLAPLMSGIMEDVSVGGNLQARIRGQILMAISNKTGALLLSTGNKSEVAVGYSTLYGDSCGGYNVLKDVYKTQVYALAYWRNSLSPVIPQRSITKAPSAELKPGQTDQDQLPPYDTLDAILTYHLEGRRSQDEIVALGFDAAVVRKVLKLVRINEYKRRQSCPGVRITPMLFGRDRRFPMTNHFTG